ncbi:MAG: MFS transporter [Candidatus Hodarchaeales archaeon]|jgi:MFS family permease
MNLTSRITQKLPSSLNSDVINVLLVMMVFNIPWGLVQPFISPYFFELTQGDYYLTGLLNGIPFITMVVSVFFFGWVVDKIGSKIVMILAFIFFIILLITLLLIADPYFFFLDYIVINGLLACFSPAVLKYASLVKTEINIFGALGAAISFGYFIGSYIGGILYDIYGMGILYLLGLGTCVIGLLLTIRMRNIRQSEENMEEYLGENINDPSTSSQNLISTLRNSKLVIVIFTIAIIQTFQGSFSGMFVSVYLIAELGAPSFVLGLAYGVATLSGTFAAHYAGKFGSKYGYKTMLLICFTGYLLVWTVFFNSIDNYLLPALSYTLPIFVGLMVAGPAIVSRYIQENQRGTVMGMFSACQYLGLGIGTILGGYYAGIHSSIHSNFEISAYGAVILILFTVIFFRNEKNDKKNS